ERLPPGLLRRGRFDEIFFVDLPNETEREAIFRLHLAKRKRDPSGFDTERLASASDGFSGSEIEGVIVGAMYRAFSSSAPLTTESILDEIAHTVPLSRTRAEDVIAMRAWSDGRATPATTPREDVPA